MDNISFVSSINSNTVIISEPNFSYVEKNKTKPTTVKYAVVGKDIKANSILNKNKRSIFIDINLPVSVTVDAKRSENIFYIYNDIQVYNKPLEKIKVKTGSTIVNDNRVNKIIGLVVEPVTTSVSDYRPPMAGNGSGGNGLDFIRISAQKNAYVELLLNFTDNKIIDILGLPEGLYMEHSVIKGTSKISGNFPLSIILDNNSILKALLIVPELPRIL